MTLEEFDQLNESDRVRIIRDISSRGGSGSLMRIILRSHGIQGSCRKIMDLGSPSKISPLIALMASPTYEKKRSKDNNHME